MRYNSQKYFFILFISFLFFPLFAQNRWWNENWKCRRIIEIPSLLGRQAYYTHVASFYFPNGGEVKKNGEDIRVIDEKGKEVPFKIIYSYPFHYSLIAFLLTGNLKTYYIYYGNPETNSKKYLWQPKAGLILETKRKPSGRADNWEEMKKLLSRSKKVYGAGFREKIFDGYNPYGPSDNYLSIYHGFFYAPLSGRYSFATVSNDASFLFVDGKLIAQWPGFHGAGGGRRAQHHGEIYLKAGIHEIEYYHMEARGSQACVAAWRKPGDKKYEVIPSRYFLPVIKAKQIRYEKRDNPYPADFYYDLLNNFYAGKDILTQVRFFSPSNGLLEWNLGDGMKIVGESKFDHVYLEFKNYHVTLRRKVDVIVLKSGKKLEGYIASSNKNKIYLKVVGGVEEIDKSKIQKIKTFVDTMEREIVLREPLIGNKYAKEENYLKIISLYPLQALSEKQLLSLLEFYKTFNKKDEEYRIIYFLARGSKGKKRWNYLFSLGNFYEKKGENKNAIITFETIAKEAPAKEKGKSLYEIGKIYVEEENFEKGKEILNKIFKECSGEWKKKGELLLGDIYFYEGKFEEAERIYKKYTKEKLHYPEGYYLQRAEYYLKKKDGENLKDIIEEWGNDYPISRIKFIPYYRGWVYWFKGKYEKARKEWRLLQEYGKSPLKEKVSR